MQILLKNISISKRLLRRRKKHCHSHAPSSKLRTTAPLIHLHERSHNAYSSTAVLAWITILYMCTGRRDDARSAFFNRAADATVKRAPQQRKRPALYGCIDSRYANGAYTRSGRL